ncbi:MULTISPECIES: transposase DNA-binding-containing protein [unclassified Azospirillum]|uniref:transposase DNA-binding-containing protein n=1 Tax=unclassified Azospirillum TaxID=2630922 RepID=UPI00145B4E87|nr:MULTISPECIES: transposase DNA-binding-containing protein [unclassified Azospirillum]
MPEKFQDRCSRLGRSLLADPVPGCREFHHRRMLRVTIKEGLEERCADPVDVKLGAGPVVMTPPGPDKVTIGLLALNDVQKVPMATGSNAWINDELAGCRLADERLSYLLGTLLDQMAGAMGGSILLACQD